MTSPTRLSEDPFLKTETQHHPMEAKMMKEVNRHPKGLNEKMEKRSLWLSHTTRSVRAFAFLVLALLAVPDIGHAKSFRINLGGGADFHDMTPGDGVCDTGIDIGFVTCTLRAAIEESNALGGHHEIHVPGGSYFLRGRLKITTSLSIKGVGPKNPTIIDFSGGLILRISNPGTKVRIFDVTLRNGRGIIVDDQASPILIEEGSSLLLQNSIVSDTIGFQMNFGTEAIRNLGFLSLVRSTVRDHQLCSDSSGFILDPVTGTPTGKCDENRLEGGGQSGLGGGIGNYGRLVVFASTISNNTAKRGGGIYNNSGGSVDITNSTISGNRASVGGGIYNAELGRVNITFSTITRNRHLAVEAARGGGGIANFGDVNIGNTILAGNTDNPFNPLKPDPSFSPDCSTVLGTERLGTFISFGGNLVGLINTNCNWEDIQDQFGEPSTGDALGKPGDGLDPLLDPLADNGGPTQTHALQKDSTARDRGTGRTPPPHTDPFFEFFDCPGTDQRGVRRPQFGFCDVGAFEAEL
jgi:hypothetical protein